MHEVWLALNIVWEMAREYPGVALGVAALLVVLFAVATLRSGSAWRRAVVPALIAGAVVAALTVWIVPSVTRSSLQDMKYWIDWAMLLAIALDAGAMAAALAWPLAAMLGRRAP